MSKNRVGRFREGYTTEKVKYDDSSVSSRIAKKFLASLPEEFKQSIPDLMVRLHPDWLRPYHLESTLLDAFDRIQKGETVKLAISVPPRHSKSESVLVGLVRYLLTHTEKEVMYLSYAQDFAESKSRQARDYLLALGGVVRRDINALALWQTTNGCRFQAGGLVGGQLAGKGADVLVIDDPYSTREQAESGIQREKVWQSLMDDAMTRLSPGGSVIILHTRWHLDDLIGRIITKPTLGFEYRNLPAIKEDGTPLWAERWSLKELEPLKEEEYKWASLYMGQPVPRGHTLFREPKYYDTLPDNLRYTVGYDLSYTAKTRADYSVAIVLGYDGTNVYVVDVIRRQCDATTFSNVLSDLRFKYPFPTPFLSYISGVEQGTVGLLNTRGLNLSFLPAKTDKFERAQAISAAWNAGRILLPNRENFIGCKSWIEPFLLELLHFTGVNDKKDDQVDALAGAYACISGFRRSVRRDLTHLPSY